MINNIKTISYVSGTVKTNTFFYFLKKLPIFKKLISDEIYGFLDIKTFVSIVMVICSALFNIFIKFIYVFIFGIGIPLMFSSFENITSFSFIFSLTIFSILGGLLKGSAICDPSDEKYTCIKLLRMSAKDYCISKFIISLFNNIISFIPAILVLGLIPKLSILQSLFLSVNIICAHIISEVIHMYLNKKFNTILGSSIPYSFFYVIFIALVFFSTVILDKYYINLNIIRTISNVSTSIPFTLIMICLSDLCFIYIKKYNNYYDLIKKSLQQDEIKKVSIKHSMQGNNAFKDVKLKDDKDLNVNSKDLSKYTGYKYLNELFFARHRRMLIKPIIKIIGIIYGITLLLLISYFFIPTISEGIQKFMKNFLYLFSLFPFLIYFVTLFSSERACRAMFFNCDISLLNYQYYRKPKVVLENFKIRLLKILKINLSLCASICLCYLILMLATSNQINIYDTMLFFASILSLGSFFSIYHLFAYYIFQPFSTELNVKNPFYSILNVVIYLICYLSMQLRLPLLGFAIAVISISIIFCIVALILVYKLAPKTFRIK